MNDGEHNADEKPAMRQDSICTTVDVPYTAYGPASYPASTGGGFAVRSPPWHSQGADEPTTADVPWRSLAVPTRIITIRDRNLKNSYIDELLRGKGLDGPTISKIRSGMRQYIDSFIKDKGINLDDGAYALLTNMIIYLIEESSRDE